MLPACGCWGPPDAWSLVLVPYRMSFTAVVLSLASGSCWTWCQTVGQRGTSGAWSWFHLDLQPFASWSLAARSSPEVLKGTGWCWRKGAWGGVFWSRGGGWWLKAKKSWEEKLALVEDRVFAAEMMGLGESLHFRVDPGLVVGETLYLQKGQSVIHTEVNVVSDYGLWCKGIGDIQNFSRHEKSKSVLNWTDPHVEDYHWWWKLNLTLWPLRPNNTLDFVESSSSESTSCEECEQEHGYRCFVCVSFSFFYFEIVRVVHRRWTQCQTARLDLCTNVLQGKRTFSTCENAGKKFFGPTTTIFAYLLSFFFFFFYQIWAWASLSDLDTVEIQHESQTNTKWSEQYQQDDWKQCMHCMTAQGDNLEGCRFDWNSL